jgi:YVTN family beta-propeller protein
MVGTERTLRRAGIVAVLVALAACLVAASASGAPLVVTGNSDGRSVSVIDTRTNKQLGEPIELESAAGAVAIVPGGPAYVAEPENDAVAVINLTSRKVVKRIQVGEFPEYLAVSPDGKTVYVANVTGGNVTVIDTATNESVGSIPVGGEPFAVSFTPNGKLAFVGVGNTLVTIDTARREVVGKPISVGEGPRTIAFSPDGATAYVGEEGAKAVGVISTALRQEVGSILVGTKPWGVAISPDGTRLYVTDKVEKGTLTVFSTATKGQVGAPIGVGNEPFELAFTPDGRTVYVADARSSDVTPIEVASSKALTPIELPAQGPWQVAVTPNQSPTAGFTAPSATVDAPAFFSGATSTDPDGTVSSYSWTFGDGWVATGVAASHAYAAPGIYNARLSVVDNEGCGSEEVFTGRTAYCSGNPAATVTHPVQVTAPAPAPVCSRNFAVRGVSHNRKNGTVRLRLRFYSTGWFLLFGKKIHAVTRKVRRPGVAVVTLHARVRLNKRLKKTHRAGVRFRVTFTPNAGCGSKTVHRSVALLRAPRKRHGHR